jgi:hypothetical protein
LPALGQRPRDVVGQIPGIPLGDRQGLGHMRGDERWIGESRQFH